MRELAQRKRQSWLKMGEGGVAGEYMALTGHRLDGAEMYACGLATHFVPLQV
jgi:enoyl-CoA hydratase/carnithine racemase